ncbi:hypothetical protein BDY19DRAFT_996909 [Irpex rosettiformis]|uniref:Uncharacterized protein n=1 Tax=Irpex rosettiformis TaxID=378272 RepID=A0ACB8TTJ7_9APHY|nr:hypothetical protein BDY19DRAFT_996909 [Irpex rosettiformis]
MEDSDERFESSSVGWAGERAVEQSSRFIVITVLCDHFRTPALYKVAGGIRVKAVEMQLAGFSSQCRSSAVSSTIPLNVLIAWNPRKTPTESSAAQTAASLPLRPSMTTRTSLSLKPNRYNGGTPCIFRLAPNTIAYPCGWLDWANNVHPRGCYVISPQAIQPALDIYGENARKIVSVKIPQFCRDTTMAVCVNVMMVGSIERMVNEADTVKRGKEFGCFASGGSTTIALSRKAWQSETRIFSSTGRLV